MEMQQNMSLAGVVESLSVKHAGREILKNISFDIAHNNVTVIFGPSGSGKTTLLRAFNRLNECFPTAETSGIILLNIRGSIKDVYRDVTVTELRRRVGMVFQTPNVLPISIAKNISMPLKCVTNLSKKEIPFRIEKVLKEVHLWDEVVDRLSESALILSGGQQQRLCLARALALEPDILLLDEPTSSLDSYASRRIEDLVIELRERYTIIAVTHDIQQLRRIADSIIIIKDGCVSEVVGKEDLHKCKCLEDFC